MHYLVQGLQQVFNVKGIAKDVAHPSSQKGVRNYMWVLLLVQLLSFFLVYTNGNLSVAFQPTAVSLLSLVAGIAGVINVVLVAQGKMTNYFWGLIHTVAYIWVSYQQHLTGEVLLNLFFFVMQFVGAYAWVKGNEDTSSTEEFKSKNLKLLGYLGYGTLLAILWYLVYLVIVSFPTFFGGVDPHPVVDSLCFALQIVGQVLMTYQYAEQWYLWSAADVFEIVLWTFPNNFNPIMVALWGAFLINSLIGMYTWNKQAKLAKK